MDDRKKVRANYVTQGRTASEISAELIAVLRSGVLPVGAEVGSSGDCYECGGGGDSLYFAWERYESDEEMAARLVEEQKASRTKAERLKKKIRALQEECAALGVEVPHG